MRVLMILVALLMLSTLSYAQPFLVSDPNPGAQVYVMNLPSAGFNNLESPAATDGSAHIDLAETPAGNHIGTLKACGSWILNGEVQEVSECSDTVPLDLTRPDPSAPSGERVVP